MARLVLQVAVARDEHDAWAWSHAIATLSADERREWAAILADTRSYWQAAYMRMEVTELAAFAVLGEQIDPGIEPWATHSRSAWTPRTMGPAP